MGFSGIEYLHIKVWGFISGLHKECGPMGLNLFWLIVPKLIMAMKVARIFSLWQWDRRNGGL